MNDEDLLLGRIFRLEEAIKEHKETCIVSDYKLFNLIGDYNYKMPEYHEFMRAASNRWFQINERYKNAN